jgi:hypothetical protein
MKLVGAISTAVLSLLLGLAAPAYAQQEQRGEKQNHPDQQQSKQEQAKPEQQHAQQQRQPAQKQEPQQHAQQQQRQDRNNQQQHAQQQQRQDRNNQQQHAQQQQRQDRNNQQHAQQQGSNQRPQRTQQQQRVQQAAWQQHRSQRWDSDHRNWQQRGGYNGYRIPDERFRGNFGQDHGFRIYGLPFLVVGGYPRFQYDGYWFSMVDPWPGYWSNDWYDTDDVYVTYVDSGYYLFDRRYPNVGIAISISM